MMRNSNIFNAAVCTGILCFLLMLRFQSVQVTAGSPSRARHYWRVLLPGQGTAVEVDGVGSYTTWTYGIIGLYGLRGVDHMTTIRVSPSRSFQ